MPLATRKNRMAGTTSVVPARKPTLFNRIVHPEETPSTHSKRSRATHRRTKATGPAPVSTHRRARSRPTLGSRIHGMAKRVFGTVKGDRGKKNAGKAMMNGVGPGTRKSTAPRM